MKRYKLNNSCKCYTMEIKSDTIMTDSQHASEFSDNQA